jgi:hypothetical protein
MKDILFISPENIYERTQIHSNIDSKMIVPEIKVCQDMYILPLLGSGLYERLQDGIDNNNLTVDEVTLLKSYVRDCLIYYVVAELTDTLTHQYWNKGVLKKTNEGSENVSMSELIDLKNKFKSRAEFYGQRLAKYLVEESNNAKFPLYINPGDRADTIVPKRDAYFPGVYLGMPYDEFKNCEDCQKPFKNV